MPAEAPRTGEKKEYKAPTPVFKEDGTPEIRKGPAEIVSVYRSRHVEPKNPDSKYTEGCYIRIKPVGWKSAVMFDGFLASEPAEGQKIFFSGELAQQTWTGRDGKERTSHCIVNGHGRELQPEEFEQLKAEKEAFKSKAKTEKDEAQDAEARPAEPELDYPELDEPDFAGDGAVYEDELFEEDDMPAPR